MDWTNELAKRGIKVILHDDENLVLETIKLFDTLFFVSSTNRWRLTEIIPNDYNNNGIFIERNILYYRKKQCNQ